MIRFLKRHNYVPTMRHKKDEQLSVAEISDSDYNIPSATVKTKKKVYGIGGVRKFVVQEVDLENVRKNDSLYKTSKICPNCYSIYKLILENFDDIDRKKILEKNRRKRNRFSSGSNFYPGSSMTSFKKSR